MRKRCACGAGVWTRCSHPWWITASRGVDPITGARLRTYRRVYGKKAAERELSGLLASIDGGGFVDAGKLTVGAYLVDRWLPHMATRVRPRTHIRYEQLVRVHVLPKIGAVKLAKVRAEHVQEVVDAMVKAGRAPRTTASAYRTLHAALKRAVRWNLLAANPAAAIEPPRAERPAVTTPDAAAVARILVAAAGTRLEVPLLIAASTGLRRGEVLGLRWQGVDLDKARASVSASLQRIGDTCRLVDPKTDRARRTVTLPPAMVALLRRHRKEQAERRLLLGEAWSDLDLVVDRGDGEPFPPDSLSRDWYRLVHRLGLPELRLHDLRHAYATRLLEAGVHPKIVSDALGHSSVAFTMDVYSHVMPGLAEQASEAIARALGGTLGE